MKILRLDLFAFGPFTGRRLALDEEDHGLHIVYGPNEAGKTSTLRALRTLLYGFHPQTSDAFVHAYRDLRVGAVLHDGNGQTLECIRRKGIKNTLRAADDAEIVDEAQLRKLLNGVGEDAFCRQFGICHADLVRGGEEIARGGGEIGQILFAAASGFAELNDVCRRLADEADSLFTPAATVKPINRTIAEFKVQRKAAKDAQLSSSVWKKHREALTTAEDRKREVENRQQQLRAELARLERFSRALPDIARRREMLDELAPIKDAPALTFDFSDRRRTAERQAGDAELRLKDIDETIARLAREIDSLDVDEAVLARQENIESLRNGLAIHLKAEEDTRARERERDQLLRDVANLLHELGREDLSVDSAQELFLTREERLRIQRLGNAYAGLTERVELAERREGEARESLALLDEELQRIPPGGDTNRMRRALARLQKRGDLIGQRVELECEVQQLEQKLHLELKRLPLWQGSLEALEEAPIPSPETIAEFERRMDDTGSLRQDLESRHADIRRQWDDAQEKLRQLDLEHDVPTEDDLAAARQRRDRGWRLIEVALQGKTAKKDAAAFLAESGGVESLDTAYQKSVHYADEIADRLRREAERVSEKTLLLAQQAKLEHRLAELAADVEHAAARCDECQTEWEGQWRDAGVEPRSPREMRAWVARQAAILESAQTLRRQAAELASRDSEIDSHAGQLREILLEFGVMVGQNESFEDLAARCEAHLSEIEQWDADRRQLERDLTAQRRRADSAREQLQSAREALEQWRTEWRTATERMRLNESAEPAEAIAVLDGIMELSAKIHEADDKTMRIEAMAADARRFAENVKNVCAGAAPDLVNASFDKATTELHRRLESAKRASIRRADLQSQLDDAEKSRIATRERLRAAQAELELLCKEAGCREPQELPAVEEQASCRRDLLRRLAEAEDRLRSEAAGAPLNQFIEDALSHDPGQATARMQMLHEELDASSSELGRVHQAIGEARNELEHMDGNARAADAQEDAEQLLAQLRDDAEQYVRLRLAAEVLRGAIQRHRDRNQGPVVKRASELFRDLTLGSFQGLRVDYDEDGRAILVGVRASGQMVPVAGMSDGSCDQLYLALRLASLEHYLENHSPLPFIVDDILITFDDERAAAALTALSELSRRTQVIFFTHHARLVELAKKRLPRHSFAVHQLPGPLAPPESESKAEEPSERTLFA